MKKLLSLSLVVFAGIMLLSSCTKRHYYDDDNEESGIVTYNSDTSPYFVTKMDIDGQYGVMYSVDNDQNSWPIEDDVLYGNFAVGGSRKVYNKSVGKYTAIEVDEFFDYESDAINSIKRKETSFATKGIKIQKRTSSRINVSK
ncbi:MAG: hypothetical protein QM640_04225 [Niabella sp.]